LLTNIAQQAGARRVYLHGCVGECKKKVWGPEDPSIVCDLCGAARFDASGRPHEFIVHFPLKDQFKCLLTCKQYQRAVRTETLRPTPNADYMCGNFFFISFFLLKNKIYRLSLAHYHTPDVYDSPWWQELLGPVTPGKLTRMGLLMCVDAVPAFNAKRKGAISLMPTELVNLSLPAHVRYDPDNMMIWMLIPSTMSANCQLKYFDYISKNELNPLAATGIPGPDGIVRIKLFGAALDLKGKEKFYNQVIFE